MNVVRIAFFIDDYLPSVHGVATSTATFRAALERMGHEVYVVAPKAEGYEETDDQLNAIGDVLEDLGKGTPMDRLICGDVGFGKTEVALRAAFVAAMAGMQVAVICPTTLLARPCR